MKTFILFLLVLITYSQCFHLANEDTFMTPEDFHNFVNRLEENTPTNQAPQGGGYYNPFQNQNQNQGNYYNPFPGQGGSPFPGQGGYPFPGQGGYPFPGQGGSPFPGQGGSPFPGQGGYPFPGQGGSPFPGQGGNQNPGQGGGNNGGIPYPGGELVNIDYGVDVIPEIDSFTSLNVDPVIFCSFIFELGFGGYGVYGGLDGKSVYSCYPYPQLIECPGGIGPFCFPGYPCVNPCNFGAVIPKPIFAEKFVAFTTTSVTSIDLYTGAFNYFEYPATTFYDRVLGKERTDVYRLKWEKQRVNPGELYRTTTAEVWTECGTYLDTLLTKFTRPGIFPVAGVPIGSTLLGYSNIFHTPIAIYYMELGGPLSPYLPAQVYIATTVPVLVADGIFVAEPLFIIKDFINEGFFVEEITYFVGFDELDFFATSYGGTPASGWKMSDWF